MCVPPTALAASSAERKEIWPVLSMPVPAPGDTACESVVVLTVKTVAEDDEARITEKINSRIDLNLWSKSGFIFLDLMGL